MAIKIEVGGIFTSSPYEDKGIHKDQLIGVRLIVKIDGNQILYKNYRKKNFCELDFVKIEELAENIESIYKPRIRL